MMRLGVDVDGVLGDWDQAVRTIYEGEFGEEIPPSTSWDFIEKYVGKGKWDWIWETGIHRGLFGTELYPYVAQVEALQNSPHDVVIITKVPPECRIERLRWLADLWIPQIKEIHLMWKGDSKATVSCDAYIDDYEVNVYEIAAAHPTKLVALLDQPWNQAAEIHRYPNVRRVFSMAEFLEMAEKWRS